LQSKNLAAFQKSGEEIASLISGIFHQNFDEEFKLNDEAKRLLEKNKAKIVNIDEEKAFSMIKKQLAKEKGFVL